MLLLVGTAAIIKTPNTTRIHAREPCSLMVSMAASYLLLASHAMSMAAHHLLFSDIHHHVFALRIVTVQSLIVHRRDEFAIGAGIGRPTYRPSANGLADPDWAYNFSCGDT
jgi:hypothetical protein